MSNAETKVREGSNTLGRVVLGVIGADVHVVGVRILEHAIRHAGIDVVNLGIMTSQEEFIRAAIETDADAILVSSVYGHATLDCRGMREKCREMGLDDIELWVGGNLTVGRYPWPEVQAQFLEMGFNRAYPPGTMPEKVVEDLSQVLTDRRAAEAAKN